MDAHDDSPGPFSASPPHALGQLLDIDSTVRGLRARGFRGDAEGKASRFALCARELGGPRDTPVRAFFVPGRLEVLGKHTDYCGGRSLIAATSQGFSLVSEARDDPMVELIDARIGERRTVPVSTSTSGQRGDWANYAATAIRRLVRDFPSIDSGVRIAFSSDLPLAAGMSSSSALLIATALTLIAWSEVETTPAWRAIIRDGRDLASYLAAVESGAPFGPFRGDAGVGTHGGSEDHTAILCSVGAFLAQWSFVPPRLERRVEVPADLAVVIAASGHAAEKTGAALERYNRSSRLARAALSEANRHLGLRAPSLAGLLEIEGVDAASIRSALETSQDEEFDAEQLLERFDHFIEESTHLVPAAAERLARGDAHGFGELVDRSQALGASHLHNQTRETMDLARRARELGGLAASAFGAGFGGSVWALTRRDESAEFLDRWRAEYSAEFPALRHQAEFFITEVGPAAFAL